MINIKLGELYGMNNEKELMQTVETMKIMGMSDADIQKVLDRSKSESEDKEWH